MPEDTESFLGLESESATPPATAPVKLSFSQVLFSFNGRIGRGTFWTTWFFMMVASLIIGAVIGAMANSGGEGVAIALYVLYLIPAIYIGLSMQIKRWHDLGYSGWVVVIAFIPFVNFIYLLVALVFLGFIKGTTGANKFGPDPLGDSDAPLKPGEPGVNPHAVAAVPARETTVTKPATKTSPEIPWDYIRKASSDNDAFFNEHKASLPALYARVKTMGKDPILMLVAFDQEKWRALLALLYKRPEKMFLTPETVTRESPAISNNGACDVYIAPRVNGQAMQTGVYGLERDWLISEFCWVKGIPPMFITLIKAEMAPAGTFTIVVLAASGMRVEHLPPP